MASNRLSYLPISAFSLFLFACPAPVDNQEGMAGGSGGSSSSGGSSGRGGSGTGGSAGGSTGGSSSSGGSTGGSSSSGGSTGGSSSSGGSGGSGTGGSTGGSSGSGGSTGGTSGTGGSAGGTGGSTGGSGGAMDAKAEAPGAAGTKLPPAIATIFMTRCGMCHNNEYRMADTALTRLKGMAGAPCSRPRMTPGMGSMSLVVQAMKGMKPCGTNMKMPPGNAAAVPAAEITMVEEWIQGGAMLVP